MLNTYNFQISPQINFTVTLIIPIKMSNFFVCLFLIVNTLVLAHAHALEINTNINQKIEQLKHSKKITMITTTPYSGYFSYSATSISKSDRQAFSCQYIDDEQNSIERFIKILYQAKLQTIPERESHLPIVGTAIYFTLADGKEIELLLGREYVNEDMLDGVITTTSSNTPITILANNTNHRLQRDLLQWASQAKEIRAGEYYYQPKIIDEIQKQWILRDAARLGKSGENEIVEMEMMNKSQQQKTLKYELGHCRRIPTVEYYRTDTTQVCKARREGLPTPFSGESSDFCTLGWESTR